MNKLIKENELVSSRINKQTILAASGSIVALYGTYLLIKHRDRLAKLFKTTSLLKNKNDKNNQKDQSRIITKEDKLIRSRARIEQDLKGFKLDLNIKSLKDKKNKMNNFWMMKQNQECSNANATYLSNLKAETENESSIKENEINLTKMSMNEVIANFMNFNVNQKKIAINLVLKSQNLFYLVQLLDSSFTDQTNPDLFEKYAFNNLDGDLYTDMLIKILNIINTLITDELITLENQETNIIDLLFIFLKKFEKNNNNTKRSTRIQEIKYLSLNILSNLINNINVCSTDTHLIEEIISKECHILQFKANQSIDNSMVYLKLVGNLLKSCQKFKISHLNGSNESILKYLKNKDLIENLKIYENEPKLKECLETIFNLLIELKEIWCPSNSDTDENIQPNDNEIKKTHSIVSVEEKEIITLSNEQGEQESITQMNFLNNSLTVEAKIF
jgi:hypothetical protein